MNGSHHPLAASGRRAALVGVVLGLLALRALTSARAEPPAGDPVPSRTARPAEGQDQAAELRKAGWYSRLAGTAPNFAQRLECYARALDIYTNLGRPQQVVEVGHNYRKFLLAGGSRAAGQGDARWR